MGTDTVIAPANGGTASAERFARLRRWNVVLGLLHLAQGLAIVAISDPFGLPVTATPGTGPPGSYEPEAVTLFDVDLAWGVAVFLFLSAAAHLLIAGPLFTRYVDGLRRGRNDFRWIEYSLSASLMVVLIAMLTGMGDVGALVALAGANAAMILFGLVQEHYERPGGSLLPFWLGSVIGAVPWIAIGIYLTTPGSSSSVPTFVIVIFVSLFLFFMSFAVNQWLQYRRIGRWRDYLTGETTYMVLSLVAKSALAWQVWAGTLSG